MASQVDSLITQIIANQYDPSALQSIGVGIVTDMRDGKQVMVDPTNPASALLEAAAVMTSAAMSQAQSLSRQQYARLALEAKDLYRHMSDVDYIGRFAIPSSAKIQIVFSEEEILVAMVDDPDTGNKRLTIPRNSYFTAGGVTFGLLYPINIVQGQHDGLTILYDTEQASPLKTLTTNEVEWEYGTMANSNTRLIKLTLEADQFSIKSNEITIDKVSPPSASFAFDDSFYFARVWMLVDGVWQELYTTHDDMVYDILNPTAVLTVLDGYLNVSIPQVYVTSGQVKGTLRVDLYQTKGPLNMLLNNYEPSQWKGMWYTPDETDASVFSAPLNRLQYIVIFSDSIVNGGQAAKDFVTLRNMVITNSEGPQKTPITPSQIKQALANANYSLVKNLDLLTNRIYAATRPMPTPTNSKLITAAAANILTLNLSMSAAASHPGVVDNGSSITITPKVVYRLSDGLTTMVPQAEIDAMNALSVEQKALLINQDNFMVSPFYYVLDASSGVEFALRAYYLDSPDILTKAFKSENDKTLYHVATSTYELTMVDGGYKLRLWTSSSDNWKALDDGQVYAQVAFVPHGEVDRAYLNGTMIGKTSENERVFEFFLASNMNIDADNQLQLTAFKMYDNASRVLGTDLLSTFDIIYSTTGDVPTTWKKDEVDTVLGNVYLPDQVKGISHETLRIRFGQTLSTLWKRSKSMVDTLKYQTYGVDVPKTYANDVYANWPGTDSSIRTVDGVVEYNIIHRAGDPIYDDDGTPLYLHRADDQVLDSNGFPIPLDTRQMLRQVDIMMIDGAYHFATDDISQGYLTELVETVVSWIVNDLGDLQKGVLEKTELYFYPKSTVGDIRVMVDNSVITTIPSAQSFSVKYYVSEAVYKDTDLQSTIETKTIAIIDQLLANRELAVSVFEDALTKTMGSDIKGLDMAGFGTRNSIKMLTIEDDANRISIRKRVVAQSDESLVVREAVDVEFVLHDLATDS